MVMDSTSLLFYVSVLTLLQTGSGTLPLTEHIRYSRTRTTVPGCHFGGTFHHLEADWHPNMEPEGLNYCISCQCVPLFKKGVLQPEGRAVCRDIQAQCPPAGTCRTPSVPTGGCCKLCPDQVFQPTNALARIAGFTLLNSGLGVLPSDQGTADEHAHKTEFTALLTGVSMVSTSRSRSVGRGRFSLRGSALSYCIDVEGFENARQMHILDKDQNVIYERNLRIKKKDRTLCGEWPNLATWYVKWLRLQQMYVRLVTSSEGDAIGGDIRYHPSLDQESFSSILQPQLSDGSGAYVRMTAGVSQNSLDFAVTFSGLAKTDLEGPCMIAFMKGGASLVAMEADFSHKADEITGTWLSLPKRAVKYMPRGKVTVRIIISSGREFEGVIYPNTPQKIIYAVLTPDTPESEGKHPVIPSGVLLFDLRPNGILNYKIQTTGLPEGEIHATISYSTEGSKKDIQLCQFFMDIPFSSDSPVYETEGSCKKITVYETQVLLAGEMRVELVPRFEPNKRLHGRVNSSVRNGHIESPIDGPVLLSSNYFKPPSNSRSSGVGWFAIDDECNLHYDVIVQGPEYAMVDAGVGLIEHQDTSQIVPLATFMGNMSRGFLNISGEISTSLSQGDLSIVVMSPAYPRGLVGMEIQLENDCEFFGLELADESSQPTEFMLRDQGDLPGLVANEIGDNCLVQGRMRVNEETWISETNQCETCSCKRGTYECYEVICPSLTCDRPVAVPGDCCMQCPENDITEDQCFFDGDQRFHNHGTMWHPYMFSFGYATCAICECERGIDNKVTCNRLSCPPLPCDYSQAVRLSPTDCCKVCPENATMSRMQGEAPMDASEDAPAVLDEAPALDAIGSCNFQGRRFPNEATWHPNIVPFGEMPCVNCHCTLGSVTCERETCLPLSCEKVITIPGRCCPVCEGSPVEPIFTSQNGVLD